MCEGQRKTYRNWFGVNALLRVNSRDWTWMLWLDIKCFYPLSAPPYHHICTPHHTLLTFFNKFLCACMCIGSVWCELVLSYYVNSGTWTWGGGRCFYLLIPKRYLIKWISILETGSHCAALSGLELNRDWSAFADKDLCIPCLCRLEDSLWE